MLNLFHIPAKGQTFQDMINIFICNYVLRNAILGNSFVTVGKGTIHQSAHWSQRRIPFVHIMSKKSVIVKKRIVDEEKVLSPALAQAMNHVKDFMTDSQKAAILTREGKTIMDAGDIKGAIECFNEGISHNPTLSLFNLRATAHKLLEMYTEAYFDYSYTIRLEPENGIHYCNRGLCLSKLKKIEMALEDFEVAIQFDPSPTHYYSRATTYAEFGKYDLAIAGITENL